MFLDQKALEDFRNGSFLVSDGLEKHSVSIGGIELASFRSWSKFSVINF